MFLCYNYVHDSAQIFFMLHSYSRVCGVFSFFFPTDRMLTGISWIVWDFIVTFLLHLGIYSKKIKCAEAILPIHVTKDICDLASAWAMLLSSEKSMKLAAGALEPGSALPPLSWEVAPHRPGRGQFQQLPSCQGLCRGWKSAGSF